MNRILRSEIYHNTLLTSALAPKVDTILNEFRIMHTLDTPYVIKCKEVGPGRMSWSHASALVPQLSTFVFGSPLTSDLAAKVFRSESTIHMIMEIVEGGDLFDRIVKKHKRGYPEADAKLLMLQVPP